MTRLVRQAVIVIYEARSPTTPTCEKGPLVLRHGHVRSTAEARREYFSAKAAKILYGHDDRPNRWHDPLHRVIGDVEITGVEALRTTTQPDACGLVAVHLRPRRDMPISLLRSLAGRRDAPPTTFDPQKLVDGQATIKPGGQAFTVSFVTPAKQGLPRLYRQPRYWRWPLSEQWLWALASRSDVTDYPPDPKNLEPAASDVIRLSSDWHAVVLRDGVGVVGMRPDRGRDDSFFGYAELYLRSIYLDAILLGVLQKQGLTQLEERMASALDSSVSATMAQLEQGVSSFRHRLWAQHLTPHGIPNRLLSELSDMARQSRLKGWWHRHRDTFKRGFDSYIGLEAEAIGLRTYQGQVMPGLLQTEAYARAAINATPIGKASVDDVDKKVAVRLSRQELLTGAAPVRLHAILDEAVLRRVVGGTETMAEQCRALLTQSKMPNITLQVLPFSVGAHAAMDGEFSILEFPDPKDPDVVYLEEKTSGLILEEPGELKCYTEIFELLTDQALEPDESAAFIASLGYSEESAR